MMRIGPTAVVIVLVAAALVVSLVLWLAQRHAAEKGATLAQERCAACHGADGNSPTPTVPKLAGQDPDYLYQQLRAFADGARASDIMAPVARPLSDSERTLFADFYSGKTIKPDEDGSRANWARGEQIFMEGSGDAPACNMCHDTRGGGMMGGRGGMMGGHGGMMGGRHMMGPGGMRMGTSGPVPKLMGQHADYIADQLDRFARGERSSQPMGNIAAVLSTDDRKAVAAYVASRN
ncbi:MAG: c-type cytochrome [Alphaproteobacteria bacterium]|nr:c-type cytochrome [Alphaproteobacteria bacterium]